MLELRPSCENCNKPLPAASQEAMICSYECTFCEKCVNDILNNICPNCGGGFCARPIRPAKNRKNNNYLGHDPASIKVIHKPVDKESHQILIDSLNGLEPHER